MGILVKLLALLFTFLETFCCLPVLGCDNNYVYVSTAINSPIADIKNKLEKTLPNNANIIYTFVPRGLIISVDENHFFSGESICIKCSGATILDGIASVIAEIENDCTIESHTEGHSNNSGDYKTNWEISMARANSIADYFIYCKKIPTERVFPLGFGEIMPFNDNVSNKAIGFDKRIDFVIFDYEYER